MNNNEIEKLAVVIGGVHHNTLGVIRGLGEKGVKTILLGRFLLYINRCRLLQKQVGYIIA